MAIVTPATEFAEILESLEPRAPLMLLEIDHEDAPTMAFDKTVRVCLSDAMHCNDIAEWYVDPISALHLVAKASRFVIDGEMQDDDGVFTSMLYDLCNARFGEYVQTEEDPIPVAAPVSCSLPDAIQFVIDAHKRVNGRQLVVTIDGAHWSVL